ncbi:MAG: ornithine carbamoyltransferase [Verrucomicrobiae bacterium]|nr:ornithine carbamoyltransferase [Verrucomicrobiae bacterium]
MKNLLTLEALTAGEMNQIFELSFEMKATRGAHREHPLRHTCWGMIFSKSSTRTRVSFEVGVRELGGDPIFLNANDIQLGRGEPIRDTARVLGRMLHGMIIRTFDQQDVDDFAHYSGIPTVNALTDQEHPCQILTDVFTYGEILRKREGSQIAVADAIRGKVVTFIGDAACNVPISWVFAAAKLGFELRLAAPKAYQPTENLINFARKIAAPESRFVVTENVKDAAFNADLLYTDVWVSMGKEAEAAQRIRDMAAYQINDEVVAAARKDAVVMHCLPAYRGKEITDATFEQFADVIFTQAENRLHVQKAILSLLAKG